MNKPNCLGFGSQYLVVQYPRFNRQFYFESGLHVRYCGWDGALGTHTVDVLLIGIYCVIRSV